MPGSQSTCLIMAQQSSKWSPMTYCYVCATDATVARSSGVCGCEGYSLAGMYVGVNRRRALLSRHRVPSLRLIPLDQSAMQVFGRRKRPLVITRLRNAARLEARQLREGSAGNEGNVMRDLGQMTQRTLYFSSSSTKR